MAGLFDTIEKAKVDVNSIKLDNLPKPPPKKKEEPKKKVSREVLQPLKEPWKHPPKSLKAMRAEKKIIKQKGKTRWINGEYHDL